MNGGVGEHGMPALKDVMGAFRLQPGLLPNKPRMEGVPVLGSSRGTSTVMNCPVHQKKVRVIFILLLLITQFMNSLGYGNGYDGSTRPYRSGRVAGGNTPPPKFLKELCHSIEEEPTCNADYKYRTILGECNNLG